MTIKHDLEHEVYIDPKDGKEHTNHGMHEYTKEDLENVHADYDVYHKDDEVDNNEGKIKVNVLGGQDTYSYVISGGTTSSLHGLTTSVSTI